jgi:hypothetical protein
MKTAAAALLIALAACAAVEPAPPRAALLAEPPDTSYEEVARIEARGQPGTHRRLVYEKLRRKADALGADAVLKLEERTLHDGTPAPYDPPQRPLLGNAYPGPLQVLEPGAFPPKGASLRVRGPYYVVQGMAIRYK